VVGVVVTWVTARVMILLRFGDLDRFIRAAIMVYGLVIVRIIAFMVPIRLQDRTGGFTTPVIFVSNHCSSIEPYLFAMLKVQLAFVTSWPFNIPIYRIFMHWAGYINADDGWSRVLATGRKLIERGCSLVVWPEGHRSQDGRLRRFRNGAFYLARELDLPVIPVCMKGTSRVMPPGSRFLNPAPVDMILLTSMKPDRKLERSHCIYELKHRVRKAIDAELKRDMASR
jgi:1-acyl-sn-glycerol-3-phosphate acyltransferase